MIIATWNINSVRLRIEQLTAWLAARRPDVVCLQEIKCVDEAFPREPLEALGYNLFVHGQKTFNGVAVLSRYPFEECAAGLEGDAEDVQAQFIHCVVSGPSGPVHIAGLYLPNGNPPDTEKYPYKLKWMDRFFNFAQKQLELEEPLVLAGDYNVIPAPGDVYDPAGWAGDALFLPRTRREFQRLLNLGLTDALRATDDRTGQYTFWDYQAGAWPKNNGLRIDHLLLSPQAADRLAAAGIDRHTRSREKPSDHVPVWIELRDDTARPAA